MAFGPTSDGRGSESQQRDIVQDDRSRFLVHDDVPAGDTYPAFGRSVYGLRVGQHLEVDWTRVVDVHDHFGHDAERCAIVGQHAPRTQIGRVPPILAFDFPEWLERHAASLAQKLDHTGSWKSRGVSSAPYVRNTTNRSRMRHALRHAAPAFVLVLFLLAACRPTASDGRRATAQLIDAGGQEVGTLTLRDAPGEALIIEGEVRNLPAGTHGIHFHAVGQCDRAGQFASAGGHFNPASRKHGLESPEGPHAGDLPNLVVGADGRATVRMTTPRVTLGREAGSLLDADGTAVVVHGAADDQRTDPSGNSGARIACGVIAAP